MRCLFGIADQGAVAQVAVVVQHTVLVDVALAVVVAGRAYTRLAAIAHRARVAVIA